MTTAAVYSLREPGEVDPRAVLTGPLRRIRRVRLAPGEEWALIAEGCEFTLFVLAGSGSLHDGEISLHHGVSVTAPLHSAVYLVAGDDGLEFFLAELIVREGSAE